MFSKILISTVALLAVSNAMKVVTPDEDTEWSTSGSHTITWEAVSTDTESFMVVLDNQNGFLEDAPVTLIQEQSTGAANTENSATVSFPNGDWPTGYGFRINLISTAKMNQAIYAQSEMFNISSSGMAGAAGSSSTTMMMTTSASSTRTMTPTTMSRSSTTGAGSSASNANSAGDASGGIPNAQSSAPNSASNVALPALPILGALAAFFL